MMHTIKLFVAALLLPLEFAAALYPQENEYRYYSVLDGIWNFVAEPINSDGIGLRNKWFSSDISKFSNATVMAVPSAFNDIEPEVELRDHIGWVWYQRSFIEPRLYSNMRHYLRFSSVNYYAKVFLNDQEIGEHIGGHLPFELEVSKWINYHGSNLLTVAVNNTLSAWTIPTGKFEYKRSAKNASQIYIQHSPNFDFFNYAGILRSVYLVRKPNQFIEDLEILAEHTGEFAYKVTIADYSNITNSVLIVVKDDNDITLYKSRELSGSERIQNIRPWWPRNMGKPNLYTLEVYLLADEHPIDVYRSKFGFRTVTYTSDVILINGKRFYCHGFGMHEDFEVIGRGYNAAIMVKDLNMLEWMNGNCYRTSHYPYSEERAMEADRRGIAVITEVPAVGLQKYNTELETLHKQMIGEMIARDRNHPSVIIWSLANEPIATTEASRAYFRNLVDVAKVLDSSRPVTIVLSSTPEADKTGDLLDIICFNRYYGWYHNLGYLDTIKDSLINEVKQWKQKYNKPVIMTEYGAEAIPGFSQEPGRVFTEQYQCEVLLKTHEAFNLLRKGNLLAGEMLWNFADFMTAQDITRPLGNHKGVLTRDRQTKMSAYLIRQRYLMLDKTAA